VRRQIGGSAVVLAVVGVLVTAPPSGAALLGGGGLNLPSRSSSSGSGLGRVVSGVVGAVSNVVGGVVNTVTSALPNAVGDPTAGYQPTLDDPGNPHGEGTVASVSLGGGLTGGGPGNTIVVGQSLGEYQTATQQFHGHITVLSLFGQQILGVDTAPGQSVSGILGTQQATIDQICAESLNTICLKILATDSKTTNVGSDNHFEAAGLSVAPLATVDTVYSDGNIDVNPITGCETSHGDSHVGDLSVLGLTAAVVDSESSSTTCNTPAAVGSAPTTGSESQVANLGGSALPLPVLAPAGCSSGGPDGTGTPNTDAGIPTLLPVVCNADNTNAQASIPYTAREALTAFVLSLTPGSGLVKATVGASQASSTAPGAIGTTTATTTTTGTPVATTTGTTATSTGTTATVAATPGPTTTAPSTNTTGTTTATPGNTTGAPQSTGNTTGAAPPAAANGNTATAATPKAAATLPFTGFNVLWLLVGGMAMLISGLALRRFAPQRNR